MRVLIASLGLACALAGCDTKPANKAVETLSFDEKQAIVEQCTKNGKIVTDKYCQEVNFVYGREASAKREQKRLDEVMKRDYKTEGSTLRP